MLVLPIGIRTHDLSVEATATVNPNFIKIKLLGLS